MRLLIPALALALLLSACCSMQPIKFGNLTAVIQGLAPEEKPLPYSPPSNYTPPVSPPQANATPPVSPPANASPPACPASEIAALLQQFNASRANAYNNCSVITRADSFPCIDTDSCRQACFASWLCREMAWSLDISFINAIRDWQLNESGLNTGMQEATQAVSAGDRQKALASMNEMRVAARNIQANPLFTVHFFCAPQDFDFSALDEAERKARGC